VTEYYAHLIPETQSCMEVLSQFDHVLFMFDTSAPFQERIGGRGSYFPAGIDAIRFCPYPNPPRRSIDVMSIGRKSEETHQALLKLSRDKGLFYVYDTIDDLHAYNLDEHRSLIANMAKRSRYFMVNPGKIDSPEETGGQSEFGYRYFEGAAPGALMIGERPSNREFERIFHWPDAVFRVPFGSQDVGAILDDLDQQPERQARARKRNMVECLRHHDWLHRWEAVLDRAGLAPLAAAQERKQRLDELAAMVEEQPLDSIEELSAQNRICKS